MNPRACNFSIIFGHLRPHVLSLLAGLTMQWRVPMSIAGSVEEIKPIVETSDALMSDA